MGPAIRACGLAAILALTASPAWTQIAERTYIETPGLAEDVAAGRLPPVEKRIPLEPNVMSLEWPNTRIGRHGGDLRTLIVRSRDVRYMVVTGYARLVGYDRTFNIVPDILAAMDVEEDRIFTLRLRKGHRWSDGHPFTAEDFSYWWNDVVQNPQLTPMGIPVELRVDGELPKFQVIDNETVRFSWSRPNPFFLPALASAAPLYIYRPSHYLKKFHAKHADPAALKELIAQANVRNWAALHNRMDNQYRNDNPDLPSLDPWVIKTRPPSERYFFDRNPYYHRVDPEGRQLPYIDRWVMAVSGGALIPAKAAAGAADLQARGIKFSDYTFLRENERRSGYHTRLWRTAKGSHIALFPNLNVNDPGWRALFRDVRFRRALSLGIDREEINQIVYFGLAVAGNNSVLPESPLFRPDYQERWASFDPKRANALLDEMGLTARNADGVRLMADGRPLEIVVETPGEDVEQTDVLQIVREDWMKIGVKLFVKPSQRELLRNRVYAGETLMSVWSGIENGLPTPMLPPDELAPTSQVQLNWPKWGQSYETHGKAGEPPDEEPAKRLLALTESWRNAKTAAEREAIWHAILEIWTDQIYTIGIVSAVPQPVVVSRHLSNVPEDGIYNWDPGAQMGIYRPDTFWFSAARIKRDQARRDGQR